MCQCSRLCTNTCSIILPLTNHNIYLYCFTVTSIIVSHIMGLTTIIFSTFITHHYCYRYQQHHQNINGSTFSKDQWDNVEHECSNGRLYIYQRSLKHVLAQNDRSYNTTSLSYKGVPIHQSNYVSM